MPGEVSHVMVFPDGGLGCLRCSGMTRSLFKGGSLRADTGVARVFLEEHAGCTGKTPPDVIATVLGMAGQKGLA